MDSVISDLTAQIPAEVDLVSAAKLLAIFAAVSLLLGIVGRAVLGKRSDLNHAVSSAIGILFIYAVTIVVYTFNPWDLFQYLSPLPFITFSGSELAVFSFLDSEFPAICAQVLSMVILAFLVNLLDSLIPKGKKLISWYLYRFATVLLSMAAHFAVTWLVNTYLPQTLVTYAPMILLGVLAFMLVLGVAKVLLGLVLTVVSPVLGAIYTFFFSNLIGKQITKAVFTTILLCGVVFLLEYLGYVLISITTAALTAYIPLIVILLILWYLLGHVL